MSRKLKLIIAASVLIVLGVFIVPILPSLKVPGATPVLKTKSDLKIISLCVEMYKIEYDVFPNNNPLFEIIQQNEMSGMLSGKNVIDAYGNPIAFQIGADEKTFTLISKGRDGILNTIDDITLITPLHNKSLQRKF